MFKKYLYYKDPFCKLFSYLVIVLLGLGFFLLLHQVTLKVITTKIDKCLMELF